MRPYFADSLHKGRVVVLGGGFVGLTVCVELANRLGSSPAEIALVDSSEKFTYRPFVHFSLRGLVSEEDLRVNFREFCEQWGVAFVRGTVVGHDGEENRVVLGDGSSLYYDWLVVGLGAVSAVASGEKFAGTFQVRDLDDVAALRRHFDALFAEGKVGPVVVVGGGISGVEIALEVRHYLKERCIGEGLDPNSFPVILLERETSVLPDKHEKLVKYLTRKLGDAGVRVLTGHSVTRASGDLVECRVRQDADQPNEKKVIRAGAVVWAGGVAPNPVVKDLNFPLDHKYNGGILVDHHLRISGRTDAFAGGDCACWVQKERAKALAATAYNAIRQARTIAANISRSMAGKTRLKTYNPRLHTPHWIALDGFASGVFAIGPRVLRHPHRLYGVLKRRLMSAFLSRLRRPILGRGRARH
ncbi:MAG: NAD(P)/FAD-dependent oxidoreductase [Promethearchaeota archaeon]